MEPIEPKYLIQVIERNTHFCKMHKLLPLSKLDDWVEEVTALLEVAKKKNPDHSYVFYRSNNSVDLAKGEKQLIQEEAVKMLKNQSRKVGITTGTKVFYLGMERTVTTFDFDAKKYPELLKQKVKDYLDTLPFGGSYTLTPNGIHVHVHSKNKGTFLNGLTNSLMVNLDQWTHDICSPVHGTTKDGFLIERHFFNVDKVLDQN